MLKKVKGDYKLGVGSNPWKRNKIKINIGLLLKKYGGGGHKWVGGLTVKPASKKDAVIREIIARLNR
jgi:nanoRNase/pAp phosphatase (c-di-AMP/oligoRNAs hydrolase)